MLEEEGEGGEEENREAEKGLKKHKDSPPTDLGDGLPVHGHALSKALGSGRRQRSRRRGVRVSQLGGEHLRDDVQRHGEALEQFGEGAAAFESRRSPEAPHKKRH